MVSSRVNRAVLAGLAMAVLGAAAGCSKEEQTASKTEFLTKGNAICARAEDRTDQLYARSLPTGPGDVAELVGEAASIERRLVRELASLDVPKGQEREVNGFLALGRSSARDLEQASKDPQQAAAALGQVDRKAVEFRRKAEAYGLDECRINEHELRPLDGVSAEKRSFIDKADAICRQIDERVRPIEEQTFTQTPIPLSAWPAFIAAVAPIEEEGLKALRELVPPEGEEATVGDLLRRRQELLAQVDGLRALAEAGDQKRFDVILPALSRLFDELDEAEREYGFQICGSEDAHRARSGQSQ